VTLSHDQASTLTFHFKLIDAAYEVAQLLEPVSSRIKVRGNIGELNVAISSNKPSTIFADALSASIRTARRAGRASAATLSLLVVVADDRELERQRRGVLDLLHGEGRTDVGEGDLADQFLVETS